MSFIFIYQSVMSVTAYASTSCPVSPYFLFVRRGGKIMSYGGAGSLAFRSGARWVAGRMMAPGRQGFTEKGKKGDWSPSPRGLYEPCGIFQIFDALFFRDESRFIIVRLKGGGHGNRAAGRRYSVTACDGIRYGVTHSIYLSIYLIILNNIYI